MSYENAPLDGHAHHARLIIETHRKRKLEGLPSGDKRSGEPILHGAVPKTVLAPDTNVGIIGGGIGGLYTALILQSLDIPYEILEASNRTGGRLFSYPFSNQSNQWQYYDVGAMRFPEIPLMKRLFNLFDYLEMKQGAQLIPYYFTNLANNGFLSYNNIPLRQDSLPSPLGDVFQFEQIGVDSSYFNPNAGSKNIVDDVTLPYVNGLVNDLETGGTTGWDNMMTKDGYTTRSYMALSYTPSAGLDIPIQCLNTDTINWCETMDKSTGWYDRGFTETVLESMAFGAGNDNPDWYCIVGGSEVLATTCANALTAPNAITKNTPITTMAVDSDSATITVTDANSVTHTYSHVVSTIPLPCIQTLDITGIPISTHQRSALRQLQYGPSIKIGIQFSTAWWTYGLDNNNKPLNIIGGQSFTDTPIRTTVYPSYGIDGTTAADNAVLIASYCWTEDAERLSALIAAFDPTNARNDPLTKLVLRDLATLHNYSLTNLTKEVVDVFPWDWNASKYSMGAFAFFGPGQFGNLYPQLTQPDTSGRFHFAGEAISAHHAWIVGALDSAWRAVDEILTLSTTWGSKRQAFHDTWGTNEDWIVPGSTLKSGEVLTAKDDLHLQHLFMNRPDLFKLPNSD